MTIASAEPFAVLVGARKRYGKIVALDGLDLDVRPAELLAVLGPNGAGKTTAIGMLLGLIAPDSGTARLFGRPPSERAARRHIGVMMQEVYLAPELRVREQIDLTASAYAEPLAVDAVLERVGIAALADRPYRRLSVGQRRQVQLGMALCGRPRLLFLDEPSVGLDVQARDRMWALLRELVSAGASIVLTTHDLEEAAALADRVLVLARGRAVASGTVDELRAPAAHKQVAFRTALDLAAISAWPEVDRVVRDRQRLVVATRAAEAVVRRLLDADPGLAELEVTRAGLADAFRRLTDIETEVAS